MNRLIDKSENVYIMAFFSKTFMGIEMNSSDTNTIYNFLSVVKQNIQGIVISFCIL